ncbi:MAG TPA: DUF58 domain-containing protein [Candidatus Anammoximicrobium sp.]|nr:DUF58 domain-containing protein [Candidatus Anammoximicrobium sp.]
MSDAVQWFQNFSAGWRTLPLLLVLALLGCLVALGRWKRVAPYGPLAIVMLGPCVLSLALAFYPQAFLLVATVDVVIVIVAAADLLSLPNVRSFSVERSLLRIASLKKRHAVSLTISNHSGRAWQVWIRDDVPQEFEATPDEFVRRLSVRSRITLHYDLIASRRGSFALTAVHVRVRSGLGLWQRFLVFPCQSQLFVYPDMRQLSEYAILARTNRLSLMGVRRTRKVGLDHDFERLRDYSQDDNYKHIDWRATARRRKLTVRDFQTSQSQRIVFLLDCGRMMTNEAVGISLLDHSLNALLMLSYVALHQGDAVGLICFSDQIHTFVPPRGGMNQMNRLLHAAFDRFPQLVESRYDEAFLYLTSRCKKRSLVVLITNLIDEVNANQIQRWLSTLSGRHLPLGVLLRDHQLFDAANLPQPTGRDLYRAAAAAEILTWRHQVLTDLQHQGVLSLDVFPEDMTAPLVNRYLEIKARHLL